MKVLKHALSIALLSLALCSPLQAQESTETPLPTEAPIVSDRPSLPDLPASWLSEIAFAALLVTSLVSLIKLVPIEALRKIPSKQVAIVLNVLIFAGYKFWLEWSGDVSQFQAYITNAGQLGDSLLKVILTFWSGEELYNFSKFLNLPILGSSKPSAPPPARDF